MKHTTFESENKCSYCMFGELEPGTAFDLNDRVFLKILSIGEINSIRLLTGTGCVFQPEETVRVVPKLIAVG